MPRTQSQEALKVEDEPQRMSGIPPWTATLVIAVVVLIVAIALGTLSGTDISIGPEPQVTIDPFGANDPAPAPPAPAPAAPAPDPAAPVPAQEYGTLRAGEDLLLPVPPGGLAPYAGRQVRGVGVLVYDVVADEGFWVGENRDDRIYVIYRTPAGGESPPDIDPGQRVTFDGTVDTVDTSTTLEEQFRLTEEEGRAQVYEQGYVIGVPSVAIAEDP